VENLKLAVPQWHCRSRVKINFNLFPPKGSSEEYQFLTTLEKNAATSQVRSALNRWYWESMQDPLWGE
jgi:hypothetical protein